MRAAFEKATGRALDEHGCIDRPDAFPESIVGSFAYDRGCIAEGMFAAGEWVAGVDSALGLAASGWSTADPKRREQLARDWVTQVVGAWGPTMQTATSPAFELSDTPAFTAPKTTTDAGRIVLDAWVQEPAGMMAEEAYDHRRWSFDAEGRLEETSLESFRVPLDRLR